MRWDELFDDLAGQFDAEFEAEQRRSAIEDERLRLARLTLRERITALERTLAPGESVTLLLDSGDRLEVLPIEFGADWFSARPALSTSGAGMPSSSASTHSRQPEATIIVPIAGISSLLLTESQVARSLTPASEHPASLAGRLGFAIPLRDLARRRVPCEFLTAMGQCFGTIDRVGRDHVDVAIHDLASVRRAENVRVYRVIPFAQMFLVRTHAN